MKLPRIIRHGVRQGGVLFMHKQPTPPNIGDELCSPRHYFRFHKPNPRLTIVGGGAWTDFGLKALTRGGRRLEAAVVWGIGFSIRPDQAKNYRDIDPAKAGFLDWGLRDPDRVDDDAHFLPCVSCLHRMLDQPRRVDRHTALFVNADPAVASPQFRQQAAALAARKGWQLVFNDCDERALIRMLNHNSTIVTNSYHGMYWSLLAGRAVVAMGYSSKFRSLFQSLGLDPSLVRRVEKGEDESLLEVLESIQADEPGVSLPAADETRAAFRQRTLAFADRLQAAKAFTSYSLSSRASHLLY